MAARGGYRPGLRPDLRPRGEADRQAIRVSLACLAAGNVLGVFPEGHRSLGRGLLPAQPGIGLLAARSGVPVWPVAVTGTDAS